MEDGNVQDISVEDKEHPALGATEEEQDVSRLNRIVVPVPSYTDPSNPAAASGSINLDLDEHPVEHSEDYGVGVSPGRDKVLSVSDTHAKEMSEPGTPATGTHPGTREREASVPKVEYPENRNDWQKKHWQAKAREYGLAVSGNTDAVMERVKEHEGEVEAVKEWQASDWKTAVDEAETQDDLAELRKLYSASGASFTTVVEAFDAKAKELNES